LQQLSQLAPQPDPLRVEFKEMKKAEQHMAKARTTTIPKEHSIWIRPMRLLLDGGHPLGPASMLWLKDVDSSGSFQFCAVTYTKDHRLVAWPVLPANPGVSNIDHVTLEFPSLECT
jgi:hypothetical protein